MSFWLLPYKDHSESCKLLKNSLGIKSIKLNGSLWKPNDDRWIVNWGNTTHPLCEREDEINFINPPSKVAIAVNKLLTFKTLSKEVLMPGWTTDPKRVKHWLEFGERVEVVVRKVVNGYGGQGIVLLTERDINNIPVAPLYTMYIPKKSEFRIHFMEGRGIIKIQRKARVLNIPDELINWKIRNLGNGFIYSLVDDMNDNHYYKLSDVANRVHDKLGLSFFCIDVLYNQRKNMYYLLEVNTAPGVNENTIAAYQKGFSHLFNDKFLLKQIKERNRRVEENAKNKAEEIRNEGWVVDDVIDVFGAIKNAQKHP